MPCKLYGMCSTSTIVVPLGYCSKLKLMEAALHLVLQLSPKEGHHMQPR